MIPLMPLHIRKLFSWILCLSFALGMLSGCGKSDGGDYLASGSKRAADGDYIAALIDFRNAVARDPQSAEARFKLGSTMRLLGDYPGAGIELKKAEELGFNRDTVVTERLMMYLNAAQFGQVLTEGGGLVLSSPDARATLSAIRGEALIATAKDAEARVFYDEALKLAPDNGLAALGSARLALISGDTRAAAEMIDFLLQKSPSTNGAWYLKGMLLASQGRSKEAAAAFESAVKVRPGDLAARFALVQARISMADFDGAFQEVSQLKKHYPNAPVSSYSEALAAYHKGEKGRALDAIRQALKLAPEDHGVLTLAGTLELERGNFASSESLLRKVMSANPDDVQSRRLLAAALRGLGQYKQALDLLQPLTRSDSSDALSLEVAGDVAGAMKNFSLARTYYKRAVEAKPPNLELVLKYADSSGRSGNLDEAIGILQSADSQALAAKSNSMVFDLKLAELHLLARQFEKARAVGDQLVQRFPSNANGYYIVGTALLGRKDQSGARVAFEKAVEQDPKFYPAIRSLTLLDVEGGDFARARSRLAAYLQQQPRDEDAGLLLLDVSKKIDPDPKSLVSTLDNLVAGNGTSVKLQSMLINAHIASGDFKRALDAARAAEALLPREKDISFLLARTQHASGQNAQALATYARLATEHPKSPVPLLGQAEVYASEKKWADAAAALDKARQLDPENEGIEQSAIQIILQRGDTTRALERARAYQAKWPTSPFGYEIEARVLGGANKDLAGAAAVLQNGLAKTNNIKIAVTLFDLLSQSGNQAGVEGLLRTWSSKNPRDDRLLVFAGDATASKSDWNRAETYYRKALDVDSKNVRTANNLAWVLSRKGSPDAVRFAQQLIQKAPDNHLIQDTVGTIYLDAGDTQNAVRLLEAAAKGLPNMASVKLNYARALIATNRKEDAHRQIELARPLVKSKASQQYLDTLDAQTR